MGRKQQVFIWVSGITGALAVIAGAFGTHGLDKVISEESIAIWEIAVRYHFYHAIPMLVLALASDALWQKRATLIASVLFLAGILIFSGSLYLLALTGLRWLGMITPIGGLALILGWATLCLLAVTRKTAGQPTTHRAGEAPAEPPRPYQHSTKNQDRSDRSAGRWNR